MKLIINGEDREFSSNPTVASLLDQLGMKPDRVAVELNRDLVPRDRWGATQLSNGDKLEIVHFVGGGGPKREDTAFSRATTKEKGSYRHD
jgi:thiamine biosynthesis protein ThiS